MSKPNMWKPLLLSVFYSIIVLSSSEPILDSQFDDVDEHMTHGHTRDYLLMDPNTPPEEHWNRLVLKSSRDTRGLLQAQDIRPNEDNRDNELPSIEEIQEYINSFQPVFTMANDVIKKLANHSAVLTGRLKSAASVREKLRRKNLRLTDLTDIIGLRLTCQTVDEALRMKELVSNDSLHFQVNITKCYGMCPGAGNYTEVGYRRIHLILLVKDSGNKRIELQIGTPYTDVWSNWQHDLVYKGPKEFSGNADVKSYALTLADYFLRLDEFRNQLPDCPKIVRETDALEILKQNAGGADPYKLFEKLGYPPNACFWWNDMQMSIPAQVVPRQGAFVEMNGSVFDVKLVLMSLLFISMLVFLVIKLADFITATKNESSQRKLWIEL